jgi:hypothetical protein
MRPTRTSLPANERLEGHDRILSGNVSFGSGNTDPSKNMFGAWADVVTPATPNQEFAVQYSLTQGPYQVTAQYYDVKSQSAACSVYKSGRPWTSTTAYFKCSVASVELSLFLH